MEGKKRLLRYILKTSDISIGCEYSDKVIIYQSNETDEVYVASSIRMVLLDYSGALM